MIFNRINPIEIPDHTCPQHLITIPTSFTKVVNSKIEGRIVSGSFHIGDIMFDPAQSIRYQLLPQVAEAIVLILEPSLIRSIAINEFNPDSIELIQTHKKKDFLLYHLGCTLKQELETGQPCQLYAEEMASFLAAHLLQYYTTKNYILKEYNNGLSTLKLNQILEYIDVNLSEDLSLSSLSSVSGISQYYFSRLFKRSVGYSPHQFIILKRIERAKKLLKDNNISISEIAYACGFSHQSHLNYQFKRVVGLTPKEYIKSI